MNVETYSYSPEIQNSLDDIIKKLRALDPTIEVFPRETPAGHFIEAKSSDSNIPALNIILNEINSQQIIRLEIIGNITQYIVDEIITYLQRNFSLVYLEVTDPKTGLIKFSLSKKEKSLNLFEVYKRDLFKFHYPRDDGRLLIFYDQGNVWETPVKNILKPKDPLTAKKPIVPPIKEKPIVKKPIQKEPVILKEEKSKDVILEPKATYSEVESVKSKTSKPETILKTKEEEIQAIKPTKSRIELSQKELIVLKLVESRPNKKVQSKGLRKDLTSMDQDTIRNVLRSLVAKGFLYVRSAWYIAKLNPTEDTWDIESETPMDERLRSLTPKERKIFEILEKRPGNKAQARMLIKETKMTKDNLKKLLRNMVAKDVLFVYAAWYCIKW